MGCEKGMKPEDRAALIFSIIPNDLMRDLIKRVRQRKDPDEVEKELENVLQALEELEPKQTRTGGKIQLVADEVDEPENDGEKGAQ